MPYRRSREGGNSERFRGGLWIAGKELDSAFVGMAAVSGFAADFTRNRVRVTSSGCVSGETAGPSKRSLTSHRV